MTDMDRARAEAEHFVDQEREFHLGMLPTEQSHPATRGFAEAMVADTRAGIRMLQAVDEDVVAGAGRVFGSEEFRRLVEALATVLEMGGRICFSGCGATGRLSILLEAAYRAFWRDAKARFGDARDMGGALRAEDAIMSIMTGGDYALVRSVESFEDYTAFGRRQVVEEGIGRGDVLVAVTEGGETSSVIGTAWQALEAGAQVFFACNNPLGVLAAHVERARRVIDEPRIVKLDLSTGPMAVAGSTRMQATTMELLVLGAALEIGLCRGLRKAFPSNACEQLGLGEEVAAEEYVGHFSSLLRDLTGPRAVDAMAAWVELEESLYRNRSAMTYFGNEFLLDMFTDTTERAPTFSLPPFRKSDDACSPRPMAFVKNPLYSTAETWRRMLGREPRCLDWDTPVYQRLGAGESLWRKPPPLHRGELLKFLIGNEDDPSRYSSPGDCAGLVLVGAEASGCVRATALRDSFERSATQFPARGMLVVGSTAPVTDFCGSVCHVGCALKGSPIRLWDHLAIKLVLNTISTATAARLGRIVSNWMAYVETTNKKLIDRGTRLVAELGGLDYAEACIELHRTRVELEQMPTSGEGRPSPVAMTLARLRRGKPAPGA